MPVPCAIQWMDGSLRLIDQTRLPTELAYRDCRTVEDVWEAIRSLRVRGAPAIGIAAAYGVVIGEQAGRSVAEVAAYLRTSRPTAVNLFWALDRMERANPSRLLEEARAIEEEDRRMCWQIGTHGAALIKDGQGVLTHCNTGGLATAEFGTALAAMIVAHQQGKRFRVFADETRPLLQGARLTTWECLQHGIDVTLICDSMAALVMREHKVHLVIVGADRIAANGDTANKVGTYGLAVLARAHGLPFYVAAPSSTLDRSLPDGRGIPIEERSAQEITNGFGRPTAPDGVAVYNPAFDVTPAELITAIITERGVFPPHLAVG
jgi:methylthioribose-1-phosphate isomerase